jgi:tetratricopeptide (TPR) repeat protein
MAECTRKDLAELLHAYELGLLSGDKRAEIELHLLECDACLLQAQRTAESSRLLKFDPETRRQVSDLDIQAGPARRTILYQQFLRRWAAPSLITVALLLFLILKDWRVDVHFEEPVVAAENRVAVLPFENMVQPNDSVRYGDIIANLLIADLSESPSLSIVSSQYICDLAARKGQTDARDYQKTATEIAKAAHARWMLTGAITQATPQLTVTTELVDVTTGTVKTGFRTTARGDSAFFTTADQVSQKVRQTLLQPTVFLNEPERPIAEITTDSPDAYREYILGLSLWQKMYIDDAEPHFKKAVALDSTFAMPYYYLSMLASGAQRRELVNLALKYVDKASARDRFLIRSRVAFTAGKQQEGLQILTEFVKRYPDDKQPLLQLARVEHALGKFDVALAHLQTAITLDSSFKEAYNQLAFTWDRLGNFENAIRAIDKYVAWSPQDANPYDSRAYLYAVNGRLDQAIESYQQALRIKPDFFSSLNSLGIMYVFKRDLGRAESCFVALKKSPIPQVRSSARLYLCYLPAYQGKFLDALDLTSRYISEDSAEQISDGAQFMQYLTAIYLEASGRLSEAIATMELSIEGTSQPDIADGSRKHAYLIHLLAKDGQFERARQLAGQLKRSLDSAGRSQVPFWDAMGAIAGAEGKPDSAAQWYAQAADSSDQFYEWLHAGVSYLQAHRLAEAVSTLERVSGRYTSWRLFWNPESVKLHYYLGKAYEESRWFDKAKQEYGLFLDIWKDADPGITEIIDARVRLKKLESGS